MLNALADDTTTRGRILRGAAGAVERLGLGPARVEDVLEAAGVSRRTFYQHFRSKEDVLDALYAVHVDALVAAMRDAVLATSEVSKQVEAAVDAYLAFQEAGGVVLALLQAEAARPESQMAGRRQEALDGFSAFAVDAVERAIGVRLDAFTPRMLLMGTDALVIDLQRHGAFGPAEHERVRKVVRRLWGGALLLAQQRASQTT